MYGFYILLLVSVVFNELKRVDGRIWESLKCRPELCKYMRCERAEKLCDYPNAVRIKNGAKCGCCDRCVIVKRKGQQCLALSEEFGEIDIECEEGTSCNVMSLRCA